MNGNETELESLLKKIKNNRNSYDLPENLSFEELVEVCEASSQMVILSEYFKFSMSMVFSNKKVCEVWDTTSEEINKQGFKYILKIIHPDNLGAVLLAMKFFKDPNNQHKLYSSTYYVNTKDGWQWYYVTTKAVVFNEDGTAKYSLSVCSSLNDVLKSRKQNKQFRKNINFYEDNAAKYLSMTKREKAVLKLIGDEFTSIEIAKKLSISTIIVDTDRKNLIKKFDVKSSLGLAKFAIQFKL